MLMRSRPAKVRLAVLFGFFRELVVVDAGNERILDAAALLIRAAERKTLLDRQVEVRVLGIVDIDDSSSSTQ